MPVLSGNLENTLFRAIYEADFSNHQYVTLEHVLLHALRHDRETRAVLEDCGVNRRNYRKLEGDLVHYIDTHIPHSQAFTEAAFDPAVQHVFQCAHHGALTFGHEIVTGAHVLWKLSLEPEGYAATMLRDHGVMGYKVREFIARQKPASGSAEGRGYIPPNVAARISGLANPPPGYKNALRMTEVMGVAARLRMVLEGCDPDVGAAAMKLLLPQFGL